MAILGKIIGGVAGFAVGGPIGALIGAVAGHGYDSSREAARVRAKGVDESKTVFLFGVIALAAKMAKADGVVEKREIGVLRAMLGESATHPEAARIYNAAKESTEGFEVYATQLAEQFRHRGAVLVEALDVLWAVAVADSELHSAEERMLHQIAEIFGLPGYVERMVGARHRSRTGRSHQRDKNQDYEVLGLKPSVSDKKLRTAYRKLVREHHPDRLVAQGMAEEFVEQANDRLAAINAAYDRIAKQRGL